MIIWKEISPNTFEAHTHKYDFQLRREGRSRWVLDIFDAEIEDPDKAHEASEEFTSEDMAKEYASSLI